MADAFVNVLVQLKENDKFVQGVKDAGKSMEELGEKTEGSGKKAKVASNKWTAVASAVTNTGLAYSAGNWLKNSVKETVALSKSTLGLARVTGMEAEQATQWAAATEARGIASADFQKSMVKLSGVMEGAKSGIEGGADAIKGYQQQIDLLAGVGTPEAAAQIEALSGKILAAETGGSAAMKTMEELGISMAQLKKGDVESVLYAAADAMAGMESATERNALALQLFGRQGQKMIPFLMGGSDAVKAQLDTMKEYSNVVGGESLDATKNMIASAREAKTAYKGLKVQIGQALIPVLGTLAKVLQNVLRVMQPLITNSDLMTTIIVVLTLAFITFKVATIAQTIAQMGLNLAMLWSTLIIIGVIAAIILITAAIIWLWKNCDWFREAVLWLWNTVKTVFAHIVEIVTTAADAIVVAWDWIKTKAQEVWNWIKDNWEKLLVILTGPFGAAVVVITRHWDTIKAGAQAAYDWIKNLFTSLTDWLKSIPATIESTVKNIPGVEGAINVVNKGKDLVGAASGGTLTSGGALLVGERGPEVVTLPQAATIEPLPLPAERGAAIRGGGTALEINVPVYLNDREIARAVGTVTSDKLARR